MKTNPLNTLAGMNRFCSGRNLPRMNRRRSRKLLKREGLLDQYDNRHPAAGTTRALQIWGRTFLRFTATLTAAELADS